MIPDDFVLGVFPVILRIHGKEAYLRRLGIDTVCAQHLARDLGLFGRLVVRVFSVVGLGRDVELDERGIGSGFKLAVSADKNCVGLSADGGTLRGSDSAKYHN